MKFQESRLLPKFIIISLLFVSSVFFPKYSLATSGCCSGHDGVNCSAGAQSNGNVICNDGWRGSSCSYSSMVMCGGSTTVSHTAAPVATVKPVIYTPTPTLKPTVKPTIRSTITPTITPTIKPTESPIPSPVVLGESATTSPSPSPETSSSGNIFGYIVAGGIGALLAKIFGKKNKKGEVPPKLDD